MPSAIHITGSTLAGIQPEVGYRQSRLYTMAYGRQKDESVKIGSLEFLQSSSQPALFNTSDPALRTGSLGEATATQVIAEIPDLNYHLAIMNPPFTSNTKHFDAEEGVLNAAFAAFDSSDIDQGDMAARMKWMTSNTCYHGHAGAVVCICLIGKQKSPIWWGCSVRAAFHFDQWSILDQVPRADRNQIYRYHRSQHCSQRQRYVLLI